MDDFRIGPRLSDPLRDEEEREDEERESSLLNPDPMGPGAPSSDLGGPSDSQGRGERTLVEPRQSALERLNQIREENRAASGQDSGGGALAPLRGSISPIRTSAQREQQRGTPLDAPLGDDEAKSIADRARSAGAAGIRFASSLLEPVMLPQDAFFATLRGAMDDEHTVWESLREVQWSRYAPFGEAPERVANGEELMELMGVEDEATRKWGGIAMDLVVDPLIFGSAARVAGRSLGSDGLVNFGNRLDAAMVPGEWGRTAYARSPQVREAFDKITNHTLEAIRNPDARLFGVIPSSAVNTAMDYTMFQRTAARLRFGDDLGPEMRRGPQLGEQRSQQLQSETYDMSNALRVLTGDQVGRTIVTRTLKKTGEMRRLEKEIGHVPQIVQTAMAREGYDFIGNNPAALMPGLGFSDDVRDLFNKVEIDGRVMDLPEGIRFDPTDVLGRPDRANRAQRVQAVAEGRQRQAYERSRAAGADELTAQLDGAWAANRVDELYDTGGSAMERAQNAFEQSVERIRKAATDAGYANSADRFEQTYRTYVSKIAGKQAEIAYELSGLNIVKTMIAKRGTEVFGSTEDGLRLWGEFLRKGVDRGGVERFLKSDSGIGPNSRRLTREARELAKERQRVVDEVIVPGAGGREGVAAHRAQNFEAQFNARARRRGQDPEASVPEPGVEVLAAERAQRGSRAADRNFTWEEILGREWDGFSPLGAGTYLAGLRNGHMYRAYGVWQTRDNFMEWARRIEEGVVIPSNILDPERVTGRLASSGYERESRLVQQYVEASQTRSGAGLVDARKMGRHIAEGLEQAGVSKAEAGRRAREALQEIKSATSAKRAENANTIRQEIIPRFEAEPFARGGSLTGSTGAARFGPRQEFNQEELEIIGELADPLVSLMQDASATASRIPANEFLARTYQAGRRSGHIRSKPYTDEMGVVYQHVTEPAGLAGPFVDKYVHPQLMTEIRKAQSRRDFTNPRFSHIRSMITGGYLAAPNIMVANLFGGVLSSWEAGIPPHLMLKAMTETFRPLHNRGGMNYDILRDLRAREAVGVQAASVQDVGRNFRDFTLSRAALEPGGLRRAGDEVTEFYEWALRGGPRATRFAGLGGFQFTETWMRTSAYKAALDMGHTKARAAEFGRTGVFDYCVDGQTEALTRRGWLGLDEIRPESDEVLALNPETGASEWQRLKDLYVGEARPREMHRLRSGRFDAFVTPGHRWVTQAIGGPPRMREMKDFTKYEKIVAAGGEFRAPEQPTHSDEFVRLVGWYVTEGTNQTRGDGVQISQSLRKNPEYVMELRALGEFYRARGATVSEYQRDIGWGTICSFYFGQGVGRLVREAAPGKRLTPEFLTSLTSDQLQILFDTLVAADGHVRGDNGTIIYTQNDAGRLDDFQFLAALLGLRTGRRAAWQEGVESVTVYRTKHVHYADLEKSVEPYEGRVWCPVTPSGTWFARRGGMTYWTGNSDLPEALRFGRDYGVLLFPGFPYFMTARTIDAAVNRPAIPAFVDRISEAVVGAFSENQDERQAIWANMPDWLRQDQGIPISRWQDEAGDTRMSFIPGNQLLPTDPFTGNPFLESAGMAGLYGPLMEVINAHLEGDTGEAFMSQRFGQRVFSPEQDGMERWRATASFLINNFAPANMRKLYQPQPGRSGEGVLGGAEGIVPRLVMPRETVNGLYTFEEAKRGRAERDLRDTIIGATIRSARPIAQSGPLIGIRNEYARARQDHSRRISAIRDQYARARQRGDREAMQDLSARARRMNMEFANTWREWIGMATEPDSFRGPASSPGDRQGAGLPPEFEPAFPEDPRQAR